MRGTFYIVFIVFLCSFSLVFATLDLPPPPPMSGDEYVEDSVDELVDELFEETTQEHAGSAGETMQSFDEFDIALTQNPFDDSVSLSLSSPSFFDRIPLPIFILSLVAIFLLFGIIFVFIRTHKKKTLKTSPPTSTLTQPLDSSRDPTDLKILQYLQVYNAYYPYATIKDSLVKQGFSPQKIDALYKEVKRDS